MAKKKKPVHSLEDNENDSSSENDTYIVGSTEGNNQEDLWIMPITVNQCNIPFKLDTGSQVYIVTNKDSMQMRPKPKLHPTKYKIVGYS
jgi:hypothetical protein